MHTYIKIYNIFFIILAIRTNIVPQYFFWFHINMYIHIQVYIIIQSHLSSYIIIQKASPTRLSSFLFSHLTPNIFLISSIQRHMIFLALFYTIQSIRAILSFVCLFQFIYFHVNYSVFCLSLLCQAYSDSYSCRILVLNAHNSNMYMRVNLI